MWSGAVMPLRVKFDFLRQKHSRFFREKNLFSRKLREKPDLDRIAFGKSERGINFLAFESAISIGKLRSGFRIPENVDGFCFWESIRSCRLRMFPPCATTSRSARLPNLRNPQFRVPPRFANRTAISIQFADRRASRGRKFFGVEPFCSPALSKIVRRISDANSHTREVNSSLKAGRSNSLSSGAVTIRKG